MNGAAGEESTTDVNEPKVVKVVIQRADGTELKPEDIASIEVIACRHVATTTTAGTTKAAAGTTAAASETTRAAQGTTSAQVATSVGQSASTQAQTSGTGSTVAPSAATTQEATSACFGSTYPGVISQNMDFI